MAKINLEKKSLAELKSLRKDVDKAIANYEKKRIADAKKEIEAIAKKHGLSVADVLGGGGAPARGRKKVTKAKGPKNPPKYRNPDNGDQTWSGRGRQPAWFKSALEAGKTPDQMQA